MEFEQIYNTYFKAVYRYIWQLSGNEHIAEEITGETFFKAMKSINNFRGDYLFYFKGNGSFIDDLCIYHAIYFSDCYGWAKAGASK